MNTHRRIRTALLAAAIALGAVGIPVVLADTATATTPGGSVEIVCHDVGPATAEGQISNTGWWWGISSDMVLKSSDIPGLPAGTHIAMGHPAHFSLVASPGDLHIVATWPDVNDEEHPLTLTVPASDCPAPPVCPDGTRPLDATPPPLGCVPDSTTTTQAPASTTTTGHTEAPPATPAAAVPTAPAFTG
jgi:hypothetical protein